MTDAAADYQAEAATLAEQAAQYRHLTETTQLAGRVFTVEYFGRLQVHQPTKNRNAA